MYTFICDSFFNFNNLVSLSSSHNKYVFTTISHPSLRHDTTTNLVQQYGIKALRDER